MRKLLVEARSIKARPLAVSRENSGTEKKCRICMDNPINTIILPCGHQVRNNVNLLIACNMYSSDSFLLVDQHS